MAFKCDNCGKSRMMGHRVSHSKRRTNHAFKPNLQTKHIMLDGKNVKVKLCTKCIKLMRKNEKERAEAMAEVAANATA